MGYFDKFNQGKGISFMDGRTKVDMPLNVPLHVEDYGFIQGDEKEYVVVAFVERPNEFVFGNAILTADIKTIEKDYGSKDEALAALANVTLTFSKHVSKKGREYVSVEFNENVPF